MSDPVIDRVNELKAKGFDMSKLPEVVKSYMAQVGGAGRSAPDNDPTVQEMPEGFKMERLKIKNLGDDGAKSIQYLQQKYGGQGYKFDKNGDGQIRIKEPNAKQWNVLDPSGFDLQDVSDVGYDIAGGALQGTAATLGGLAGMGGGSLPAAMAAGAASGAGIEAARQGLGKMAGINDFDTSQIGMAGVIGGVAPGLLGSGATAAQVGRKLVGESGEAVVRKIADKSGNFIQKNNPLTKENIQFARETLENSQKGILSDPFKKIGAYLSGIPEKVLGKMNVEVPPVVKDFIAKSGYSVNQETKLTNTEASKVIERQGIEKFAANYVKTMDEAISGTRAKYVEEIGSALDASGKTFDMNPIIQPIQDLIENLESQKNITDETAKVITQAKAIRDGFFAKRVKPQIEGAGLVDEFGRAIVRPVKGREIIADATATEAMQIKNTVSDLIDFQSKSGDHLPKQLRHKLMEGHSKLADEIYNAIDGGPELRSAYKQNEVLARYIKGKISHEEGALKALKNLDNNTYAILHNKMQQFDSMHGTGLTDLTDVIQNWNYFAKPQLSSAGGRGSEVTQRARWIGMSAGGGIGGLLSGFNPAVTAAAGAAGGVAGQTLTSPSAIKQMSKVGAAGGAVKDFVGKNVVSQGTIDDLLRNRAVEIGTAGLRGGQKVPSAWMMMQNRGEK